MKKNWMSFLLCAVLVLSLCACGKTEHESTNSVKQPYNVTAEEQLGETGIALYPPYTAVDVEYWMVESPTDGEYIPEVTFVWEDNTYHYRAEETDRTEPYDFTGLDTTWTDEGSFGSDDRVGTAHTSDTATYLCWVENGVAYLVYSETTNDMFASFDVGFEIATMDSWGGQIEDPDYEDDGEITVWEASLVEQMMGTWQYDESGAFLRICNFFYTMYDSEGAPVDELIRFWEADPERDDTICLLNENGELYTTLTIPSDEDIVPDEMTDGTGATLHRYDGVVDGTYRGYISHYYLEDKVLYVLEADKAYLPDEAVQSLQMGDIVDLSVDGFHTLDIDKMEKLSDTEYSVNMFATICYDSAKGAWQVLDNGFVGYTMVGNAPLSDTVQFDDVLDDGEHTDLASCLEAHDGVYGNMTVAHGEVISIQVDEAF